MLKIQFFPLIEMRLNFNRLSLGGIELKTLWFKGNQSCLMKLNWKEVNNWKINCEWG